MHMNIFDFCRPDEQNHLMNELKDLSRTEHTMEREFSFVRSDGSIRIVAHNGEILTYGGQRVVQSVMRDITNLKLAQQKEKDLQNQLMRSERLSSIGRLAAWRRARIEKPALVRSATPRHQYIRISGYAV